MIYRADETVLNYLLTTRLSFNQEELHDPTNKIANYILIDYFDFLRYASRVDNAKLFENDLYSFKIIYNQCQNLINLLQFKLTSDKISHVLQENKKTLNANVERTLLEHLCQGYSLFVDEVLSLQVYLLNTYKYNNFTLPILLIPFSFGLNRLSSGHINLKEEFDTDGMLKVDVHNGIVKDECVRSKLDFGIRTYTYHKKCEDFPYNLPYTWQVSKVSFNKKSEMIRSKMPFIADCYSQYCYTGFVPEDTEKSLNLGNTMDEGKIKGKKLFSSYFMLNFPFLLPSISYVYKSNVDGTLKRVLFEET